MSNDIEHRAFFGDIFPSKLIGRLTKFYGCLIDFGFTGNGYCGAYLHNHKYLFEWRYKEFPDKKFKLV